MVLGIIIGIIIAWTVLSLLCQANEGFHLKKAGVELFDGWLSTALLIPSYIILFVPFKVHIAIKKMWKKEER